MIRLLSNTPSHTKRATLLPPDSSLICHLTADAEPFRMKPSTEHLNKKSFLCHRKSVQAPTADKIATNTLYALVGISQWMACSTCGSRCDSITPQ